MSSFTDFKKRKKKAKDRGNLSEAANLCKLLAIELSATGNWEEAIAEYEDQLHLLEAINDKVGVGITHRRIGEVLSDNKKFEKALQHQNEHLAIATEASNVVEIQRAWAVISQTYLKKCDFVCESEHMKTAKLANEACRKAYESIKNITGEINSEEHAQMRARALLNQGIALDIQEKSSDALPMLNKALELCKKYNLTEDSYRVYSELAKVHFKKGMLQNAVQEAVCSFQIAEKLGDQTDQIDSLSMIARIHLSLENYESAKKYLFKSYHIQRKKSRCAALENVEFLLKKTIKICEIRETLNENNISTVRKLECTENLGDLCLDLGLNSFSVRYYKKVLSLGTDLNKDSSYIAKIFESLGRVCKDNKDFQESMSYFEKELAIRKELDDKLEAIMTLIEISFLYHSLNKNYNEKFLNEALRLAKCLNSPKLQAFVLNQQINTNFIPYTEKVSLEEKYFKILEENHLSEPVELSDVDADTESDDDISLSKYFDSSNSDEETANGSRKSRKVISRHKVNNRGETVLHEASIKGNVATVKRLLSMQHPVNTRDYCGWTPLHEACNRGYVEIASILIEAGANINDRGGKDCKGITPLHDCGTNGHLECMRLLIQRGALVCPKEDSGNTPLDFLFNVIQKNDLNNEEMEEFIETVKLIVSKKESLGYSISSTERNLLSNNIQLIKKAFGDIRNNSRAANDLSADSSLAPFVDQSETATDSYVSAMKNVGSKTKILPVAKHQRKVKESLIVDDWLIQDTDYYAMKKRKRISSPETVCVDRSTERKKKHVRTESKKASSSFGCGFNSNSSFDGDCLNKNIPELNVNNNEENYFDDYQNDRVCHDFSLDSVTPLARLSHSPIIINCDNSRVSCDTVSQCPFRLYVNIFHGQKFKGKFLIPVPPDCQHKPVSWLENEASNRYFESDGMKAVISLTINDATKLNSSDEVARVLSNEMCLRGEVISCEIPNLHQRYRDVCSRLKRPTHKAVSIILEKPTSNVSVDFSKCFIRQDVDLRCVIKSVQHQHLFSIDLSSSRINNDNLNLLLETLSYLPELQKLLLQACSLTTDLCDLLINYLSVSNQIKLSYLDLSYNNLSELSLKHLKNMIGIPYLRDLRLKSCSISISGGTILPGQFISSIETLFLDDNTIEPLTIISLLEPLKGLKDISLSGCLSNNPGANADLMASMFHGNECILESVDLSACNLGDQHVSVILSSLHYAKSLRCLNLSFNANICKSASKIFHNLTEYSQNPLKEVLLAGIKDNGLELMHSIEESIRAKISYTNFQKISFPANDSSHSLTDLWKNIYHNKACVSNISSDIYLSLM